MPNFSAESLSRHETYRSLKALHNQYSKLATLSYPSEGSDSLISVSTEILERIIGRFDRYSDRITSLLSTGLLQYLQDLLSTLSNSTSSDVAWSIIPSLDALFSRYKKNSQFVISSLWERTYAIEPDNALESLRDNTSKLPGILADTVEESEEIFKTALTTPSCENIFILYYPRIKRLSATHFANFGHEIGHMVFIDWRQDHLVNFHADHNIKGKVEASARDYVYRHGLNDEMIQFFSKEWTVSIVNCLKEICCDIVGCITFGFSFLLSLFKFSSIYEHENHNLDQGYFSWAYRIELCLLTLKELGSPYDGSFDDKIANWIASIKTYNSRFESTKYILDDDSEYRYQGALTDAIRKGLPELVKELKGYLIEPGLTYEDDFNGKEIESTKASLEQGIIPCSTIEEKDNLILYSPLDMRNIISGTWQYIIATNDFDLKDTRNYYKYSRTANLLSLKGIEMAKILSDFEGD